VFSRRSGALHEVVQKTLARGTTAWCALALASVVTLTPACSSILPSGPTPVAQGKYYGSGNAEFDAFFIELYKTQLSVGTMPDRFAHARNDLTDGLAVSRDLKTEAVVENVGARAHDLSKQGVVMKLQLNQNAVVLTRPQERSSAVRQLAEPVEKASNDLLSLTRELADTQKQLDKLELRRNELKGRTSATFGLDGAGKVREVDRNLEDAGQVLLVMRERATDHQKQAQGLLAGLAKATDTSNGVFERGEPAPEATEEAEAPAPKRGPSKATRPKGHRAPSGGAPKSSAKPASAPPPPPKPAPKPAPSDGGFEP
jgi:hypothetical protein